MARSNSDARFAANLDERRFIRECRDWATNAAPVDILLDFAWVLHGMGRQYHKDRDDVLRLRQSWLRKYDPETLAEEKRMGVFQPGSFSVP